MRARILTALVFSTAFAAASFSQEMKAKAKPQGAEQLAIEMKSGGPCIYLERISKSSTIIFGNICNQNMEFVISWSGLKPTYTETYRVNAREMRSVKRQDRHGILLSESPAHPDRGQTVAIHVVDSVRPQGVHLLSAANTAVASVYISAHVDVFDAHGALNHPCDYYGLVGPSATVPVCFYQTGQTYKLKFLGNTDPK